MNAFFKEKIIYARIIIFLFIILLSLISRIPECFAKTELVWGEFYYTYGDNESLNEAKEICKREALKHALESAMVYIKSETRVNMFSLESMDVHSLAVGCLEGVEILEESVNDRTVHYKIRGLADVSLLKKKIEDIMSCPGIVPNKKIRFTFYVAKINKNLSYCSDDTTPAPDSYIIVKDKQGNTVFTTGHYFLDKKKYGRLILNRNNYNPDFEGASFTYTYTQDNNCLLLNIADWDGIEGILGLAKSEDDVIGYPYRIPLHHPLGKRWIRNDCWKLEMDIRECN